jgi:sulfate permease, SulP family
MALTRYQTGAAAPSLWRLPAAALRAVLREGYTGADLRRDALAGVVVGTVALPLSMALSIAVGAPPQYGLYTAIVGGFVVAFLGGSRTQVTGPTAAFVVILAPIHARFGDAGLFVAGLLAGVMLIAFGLLRLGKLIEFIPHPVTTGFTAGIATVIATLQVKDLFGLRLSGNPEHFFERIEAMWRARATAAWPELAIGVVTLVLLLGLPRVTKRVPAPLVALPAAAVLAFALAQLVPGFGVSTIASRFSSVTGGVTVHGIPRLPPLPILPWNAPGPDGEAAGLTLAMLRAASRGAFAIAMLAAIESLLSAVVADGMARTRHDPDAELFALGVGNVVTPFFGGIPATGAIARTATNIRSGGRSPVAAMVHSATVLVAVLLLAPLMGYVPMASLAALLLLVAWNMSEARFFAHTLRVAPKSDVAILVTCYGLTVAIDMVVAVSVGVVLAALLFMRRMAEVTEARVLEGGSHESTGPLPPGVVVYDIDGPLFFGAAQKAMAALGVVDKNARAVVLRMDGVPALDSTGLVALESALDLLRAHRCMAVITGLRPQPEGALKKAEVEARHKVRLARDLPEALALIERVKGGAGV